MITLPRQTLDPLKPAIGRWTLASLIVNSVIGAGIFALPSSVAKLLGQQAPLGYIFGAAATSVIVAVVVELSSQFRKPGGAYIYVRDSCGAFTGVQTGLFSWLARITTAAAITNLLVTSLGFLWPAISSTVAKNVTIITILATLAMLNVYGVKFGAWTSNICTGIKVGVLLTLISLGLLHWHSLEAVTPAAIVPSWKDWIDALVVMVFAYSGFESAMIPGSELKNPRKNTCVAAFSALILITVVYLLLHLVVMRAVPNLASSERPLADAAAVYAGSFGERLVLVATIVSTFGWLSAAAVTAPRLTYAMSLEGDFPAYLGLVHARFRTPWISIWLWCGMVTTLSLYGNFMWNVLLSVTARLVVYSTMCAAVIQLRLRLGKQDAWRMPFGFALPCAGILFCLLLASRLKVDHLVMLAIVGASGVVAWLAARKRRNCVVAETLPGE